MSEIARLREQIEVECEALRQALGGYASVARHDVISRRYSTLGRCQQDLEQLVGKEEAENIVVTAYVKAVG